MSRLTPPIPFSNINPTLPSSRTLTASGSLVLADAGGIIRYNSASAGNITVPNIFQANTMISFYQLGAGAFTLVAGSGVTLNKAAGLTLSSNGADSGRVFLVAHGGGIFSVFGALA